MSDGNQPIQYKQFNAGHWEVISGEAIVETPVSLTVNGDLWLTWMCTPVDVEALAVGFLFNEGLIATADEVASIRVCPTGDNVDIWLTHSVEKPPGWRRTSGCAGGQTGVTESDSSLVGNLNGDVLPAAMIGKLIGLVFDAQDLYRHSGGVHTSALSDGERLCLVAEDIGRHNTLDKIAGRCLLEGVALKRRVLLTTGRVSSEMLQKAARMKAPIVISRTAPSSLSIRMAEAWGITLIGYARRNRFNVYTHPERILSDEPAASDCACQWMDPQVMGHRDHEIE